MNFDSADTAVHCFVCGWSDVVSMKLRPNKEVSIPGLKVKAGFAFYPGLPYFSCRPLITWGWRGADFLQTKFIWALSVCVISFSVRFFFLHASERIFFFNLHHAPQMINDRPLTQPSGKKIWIKGTFPSCQIWMGKLEFVNSYKYLKYCLNS